MPPHDSTTHQLFSVLASNNCYCPLADGIFDSNGVLANVNFFLLAGTVLCSQTCSQEKQEVILRAFLDFPIPLHPPPPSEKLYCTCQVHTYRRIPRIRPPFVHARIGQKWGGGLYAGSLHFRVTTITSRRMPRGRAISGCLVGKTRVKRQSKA